MKQFGGLLSCTLHLTPRRKWAGRSRALWLTLAPRFPQSLTLGVGQSWLLT